MNSCCKFCGQVVFLDAEFENKSEEECLEEATLTCGCPDARLYQDKVNNLRMAKEKVDEIISSVDINHNITGLDDKTVEKFKNTLDLLVDGTVKSVGFEFADNVGTITATANAMGKVTVERKLTTKEKV